MAAAEQVLAWIDARRWWLFALAAIIHMCSFNGQWHIVPDSAVFLGISENLVQGRGFMNNGEPVTNIQPGFPFVLAAVRATGIDVVPGSLIVVHSLGILTLWLVFLLLRRAAGRPIAVLVTFLTAVSAVFLRHCLEILADIPFMFGCVLMLLGYEWTFPPADKARQHASDQRPIAGSILVALAIAFMASMRLVVLGPLAALVLDVAWRVRRSRAKWFMLLGAGGAVVLALTVRLADPRMAGGFKLLQKEREIVQRLADFPSTLSRSLHSTLPDLLLNVTPRAFFGNKAGFAPADLLLTALILVSGVALVRRRILWGALVFILFAQWAIFFADTRYFLPILPLLYLGWWDTGVRLSSWCARPGAARGVLIASILLVAAPNLARSVGFVLEQHRSPFYEHYLRGRYENLRAIGSAAHAQLPPDSVVLCAEQFAEPFHLFSQIRTIGAFESNLLKPVPRDRPLFILLPGDDNFDKALKAAGVTEGETVLSMSRLSDPRPIRIARAIIR
ncbi:MAG: hypothetical protein U0573_13370 [Phycisphaerales bacterium]|nr:hypothetical protein [Planctomycetota bacterium]